MATKRHGGSAKHTKKTTGDDAISLLKADHREVEEMFEQYESSEEESEKREIADQICAALTQHAEIEERLFYPAARQALEEEDAWMIAEAKVEHQSLKRLIADIEGAEDGEMFEARVKVLSEYVKHHVKEEEKELMPKVAKTDIDLESIGEEIRAAKESGETAEASSAAHP